jgi:secondary thiamine-phosphate synthase enzyme
MSGFKVFNTTHSFSTGGAVEFVDLTGRVHEAVAESQVKNGLVHIFAPHATGVLILTEDETGLLNDIREFFERLVPKGGGYEHPSNAFAHLRSMVFPPDRTLPVVDGHAVFGTWQSLMFVETDVSARRRTIIFQVIGET